MRCCSVTAYHSAGTSSVTILNQNLGSRESTVHGSHMQRAPALCILKNKQTKKKHRYEHFRVS